MCITTLADRFCLIWSFWKFAWFLNIGPINNLFLNSYLFCLSFLINQDCELESWGVTLGENNHSRLLTVLDRYTKC